MNSAKHHKEIQALTSSLKEQASQIQKVGAELELQKAPAQTVLKDARVARVIGIMRFS